MDLWVVLPFYPDLMALEAGPIATGFIIIELIIKVNWDGRITKSLTLWQLNDLSWKLASFR